MSGRDVIRSILSHDDDARYVRDTVGVLHGATWPAHLSIRIISGAFLRTESMGMTTHVHHNASVTDAPPIRVNYNPTDREPFRAYAIIRAEWIKRRRLELWTSQEIGRALGVGRDCVRCETKKGRVPHRRVIDSLIRDRILALWRELPVISQVCAKLLSGWTRRMVMEQLKKAGIDTTVLGQTRAQIAYLKSDGRVVPTNINDIDEARYPTVRAIAFQKRREWILRQVDLGIRQSAIAKTIGLSDERIRQIIADTR